MEGRYASGGTAGGKWGCAAATLDVVPLFAGLLLVDALGDCMPDSGCTKGFWSNVALPSAIAALVIGFGVRWLVNRVFRAPR